jgi:hypothetical protein
MLCKCRICLVLQGKFHDVRCENPSNGDTHAGVHAQLQWSDEVQMKRLVPKMKASDILTSFCTERQQQDYHFEGIEALKLEAWLFWER